MARSQKTVYVCTNCGAAQPKWMGKCPECGAWNSLVEERVMKKSASRPRTAVGELQSLNGKAIPQYKRYGVGIDEFDRVLGGGFIPGMVVLMAGEPGIGKSTVVLQLLSRLQEGPFLYFSGEESAEQIQLRARRLGIRDTRIQIACDNNLENILHFIQLKKPIAVVIDSIQTAYSEAYDNVPGSVTQVRECAERILREAKASGFIAIFVGHITKVGMIAGPKVLEHLVDTVLYLEGGKRNDYRILRAVKNRFGSTNEIGLFVMRDSGLQPVDNPSEFFLMERRKHVPGSAIAVSMEGTRPFLIEVQALVTQSAYGHPQRTANGIDHRRLAMLIAVLEKRIGLPFGMQDVFVNLVGGLKIDETAINLAVVVAMASSFREAPLNPGMVFIGEVGLVGEIRSAPFIEQRVKEALKFGFTTVYVPRSNLAQLEKLSRNKIQGIETINQLFDRIF